MKAMKVFSIFAVIIFSVAVSATAQEHSQPARTAQDTSEGPPDYINVDKMPAIVSQVTPVYPELAQKAGIQGRVIVKVWIDKEGNPHRVVVLKSSNPIFDESAIDAAMNYRFTPALLKQKPVDVWVVIPFSYKLKEDMSNMADSLQEASAKLAEMASKLAQMAVRLQKSALDTMPYHNAEAELKKALKNFEEYKVQAEFYSQQAKEMMRQAKEHLEQLKKAEQEEKQK